jgi:hypothetical protein
MRIVIIQYCWENKNRLYSVLTSSVTHEVFEVLYWGLYTCIFEELAVCMLQIETVSCFETLEVCHILTNAAVWTWCFMSAVCLCAGVIWPIEGMPCVLRYISLGLPLTMATTSLRSMLSRGWSIVEPDVYNGYISTIIWIVLFLSISLIVLKFKRG